MADKRENGAYTKAEMVRIKVDDQVQPAPVPAAWLDTDLLPAGATKATKAEVAKADGIEDSTPTPAPPPDPNAEPAGNASTEAWADYATRVKGAKAEDLVDGDGKPLTRDALREKYGTPTS